MQIIDIISLKCANPQNMKKSGFIVAVLITLGILSCEKDRGLNFFTISQDIEFGETMDSVINANPEEYPILDPYQYSYAYNYMNYMMNKILSSGQLKYADQFDWKITIINKDIMNAFAVPGGKLYFYTGLMKYLDDGASLAGVLGHEMAHVDLRHSTSQLTKTYTFAILLSLIVGEDKSMFVEIAQNLATGLASLQFSRENEYDADRYSMYYLATTKYDPRGISSFFIKLKEDGHTAQTFEFLSTHPSDDNRINHVDEVWTEDANLQALKRSSYGYYTDEYADFISSLP